MSFQYLPKTVLSGSGCSGKITPMDVSKWLFHHPNFIIQKFIPLVWINPLGNFHLHFGFPSTPEGKQFGKDVHCHSFHDVLILIGIELSITVSNSHAQSQHTVTLLFNEIKGN